jgi:non-ribosomal peptide synthetase component E (peptide arylation enzyme)
MVRDLVPKELRAEWTRAGHCPGKDLFSLFEEQVAGHPDKVAVVDDAGECDYATLGLAARRVANGLARAGIGAGDVVGVQVPNSWQACAIDLAAVALGAVVMPYPVMYRERETEMLLGRSRAVALVVARHFGGHDYAKMVDGLRPDLPGLRQVFVLGEPYADFVPLDPILAGDEAGDEWVPRQIDPDAPARILVTSGTEAAPKMVLFSHNAIAGGIGNIIGALGTEGMRNFCLVPLSSGFGAIGTFATLARHGGTLVVTAAFDPGRAIDVIERQRPTHILGVPTMFTMMLATGRVATADTTSLRVIATYGSSVPLSLIEDIRRQFGCAYVNGYGCSDGASSQTALDDPPEKIAATVGRPNPAVSTIRVVDPEGNDVAPGAEGEIWARGPLSPLCYFNSPELDERYRTPDGWAKTGDLGVFDEDGYVRIVGRIKDIINRGGLNISPAEVEEHILDHPAVLHAACVAMPDELLGERMCAYVVLRDGAEAPTLDDLSDFLLSRGLAKVKLPERLEVVTEMPLNPTGKILKRVLRDRLTSQP